MRYTNYELMNIVSKTRGATYVRGATSMSVNDTEFDCNQLLVAAGNEFGITYSDPADANFNDHLEKDLAICPKIAIKICGAGLHFDGHVGLSMGDNIHTFEARGKDYPIGVFERSNFPWTGAFLLKGCTYYVSEDIFNELDDEVLDAVVNNGGDLRVFSNVLDLVHIFDKFILQKCDPDAIINVEYEVSTNKSTINYTTDIVEVISETRQETNSTKPVNFSYLKEIEDEVKLTFNDLSTSLIHTGNRVLIKGLNYVVDLIPTMLNGIAKDFRGLEDYIKYVQDNTIEIKKTINNIKLSWSDINILVPMTKNEIIGLLVCGVTMDRLDTETNDVYIHLEKKMYNQGIEQDLASMVGEGILDILGGIAKNIFLEKIVRVDKMRDFVMKQLDKVDIPLREQADYIIDIFFKNMEVLIKNINIHDLIVFISDFIRDSPSILLEGAIYNFSSNDVATVIYEPKDNCLETYQFTQEVNNNLGDARKFFSGKKALTRTTKRVKFVYLSKLSPEELLSIIDEDVVRTETMPDDVIPPISPTNPDVPTPPILPIPPPVIFPWNPRVNPNDRIDPPPSLHRELLGIVGDPNMNRIKGINETCPECLMTKARWQGDIFDFPNVRLVKNKDIYCFTYGLKTWFWLDPDQHGAGDQFAYVKDKTKVVAQISKNYLTLKTYVEISGDRDAMISEELFNNLISTIEKITIAKWPEATQVQDILSLPIIDYRLMVAFFQLTNYDLSKSYKFPVFQLNNLFDQLLSYNAAVELRRTYWNAEPVIANHEYRKAEYTILMGCIITATTLFDLGGEYTRHDMLCSKMFEIPSVMAIWDKLEEGKVNELIQKWYFAPGVRSIFRRFLTKPMMVADIPDQVIVNSNTRYLKLLRKASDFANQLFDIEEEIVIEDIEQQSGLDYIERMDAAVENLY